MYMVYYYKVTTINQLVKELYNEKARMIEAYPDTNYDTAETLGDRPRVDVLPVADCDPRLPEVRVSVIHKGQQAEATISQEAFTWLAKLSEEIDPLPEINMAALSSDDRERWKLREAAHKTIRELQPGLAKVYAKPLLKGLGIENDDALEDVISQLIELATAAETDKMLAQYGDRSVSDQV